MAEQVSRSLLLLSDKPKSSVLEICKICETPKSNIAIPAQVIEAKSD
jgi:hypothetical protein